MPNLLFSEGESTTAAAMLGLAAAEILILEDTFVKAVNLADDLARRARDAGQEHARLNAIDALSMARDSVLEVASSGGDVEDAAAIAWRHADDVARALVAFRATDGAATLAARDVHGLVRHRAADWGTQLLDELNGLLNSVDRFARIMADAPGFDFADPSAVHAADRPIQQAFNALTPMAAKHDLIRSGAIALWVGSKETWSGIEHFGGFGVERYQARSTGPHSWRWRPRGHAVARLCAAVAEEPGDADEGAADGSEAA